MNKYKYEKEKKKDMVFTQFFHFQGAFIYIKDHQIKT